MRMWHYRLLPYLPDLQLKGQLRELIAIMHNWRDKGLPKHMLVNNVVMYPKTDFYTYFEFYKFYYESRFGKSFNKKYVKEFQDFCGIPETMTEKEALMNIPNIYTNWHTKEYLRICMANLYEKYIYSCLGTSAIDSQDWNLLCSGYKAITGEEYSI